MVGYVLRALVPGVSTQVCKLLDDKRGSVPAPIRSEIFGAQRFAQHGRSLGTTHHAARMSMLAATFFPRLKSNIRTLRETHHYIGLQASTGYDISPAAEWLLDNFHTIEAQVKEIHEGLPRSYFRALPMLLDEPLAGLPRVYGVAWAFVAHTDGAFDEELLKAYLKAYQETRELKLSELWALPTTLRVVLTENLRRLAERVATTKAAREIANICFDHIDSYTPQALDRLLALLNQRGVGRAFLAQMARRQQDRRLAAQELHPSAAHHWLRTALPDWASLHAEQSSAQAADNLSVSNAVTSLRAIGDADWTGIICACSALMQTMLGSALFAAEDATTRNQTLHAIERLAQRSNLTEVAVAQALLDLMRAPAQGDGASVAAHHWLHGSAKASLRQALGLPKGVGFAWRRLGHAMFLPAYLAVIVGVLWFVVWQLLHRAGVNASVNADVNAGFPGAPNAALWLVWMGTLAMVFPASEAVVAVINRMISESARPQHVPRLAFVDGIPPEHRVIVVIPSMLTSTHGTIELVQRLELHYLANLQHHAQFALLSDWADADNEHQLTDMALLNVALHHVEALNQRYPRVASEADTTSRFLVLHRNRTFSQGEKRWLGWERKRGKLEQLISVLARGVQDHFLDLGSASAITPDVKYIVTLDSDTQLPPGRLRELVGIAAHPHNQPVLDSGGRNVASGYAILQPRIVNPLPSAQSATIYHWLFAGQCGTDPYSAASSEIYQDLFFEGSYTGKGLLNVQAMHAVLHGRLPENLILSHDLIEGAIARCALVTDLTLIEEAPSNADVAAARVHRWARGDWQLLPVFLPALFRHSGHRVRPINLWKMLDNLRRSLVSPMSLVFLVVAFMGASLSAWWALALVYVAFSAGPLIGAVAGFSPGQADVAKLHFFREAALDLVRALGAGIWHVAQLLQNAMSFTDAIARALYRTYVSKRQLMQWTTMQVTQAQANVTLVAVARLHWRESALAVVLWVALYLAQAPHLALAAAMCLVWAASPVWTWWVSKPAPANTDAVLLASDRAYLDGIARDTWRLFERCVGAQDNHLPPDNLQLRPHDMVAHRTSPTNIGLYLLSVACARQFGWIGTQELIERLQATLATLQTLQRHRGHFLNWYDTQTCAPLLPQYVSTVDSGNLSAHLLALAQACTELALQPYDDAPALRATAAARQRMAPLLARRRSLSPTERCTLRWQLADYRATRRSAARDELACTVSARAAGAHAATQRLQALASAYTQLAWEADFSFLYHPKRHLLHIGYRVAEHQPDAGFYDLMASESRLTSLIAIAKGDVPVRHWSALGRPFFAQGISVGLRSWTGSMFEYLMPSLVLDEPHGSVLSAACVAAVHEQIAFGAAQGVPWGISECAYAGADHTLAYQYAPQGVPRLALRRTPADELVIAPYATALAALVCVPQALDNFRALEALGARGRYGFMEALDYTPARCVGGEAFSPVDTVMAHHQAMSIVALADVLLGGPARRWTMANASIQAMTSLLHERLPREVSVLYAPPEQTREMVRQRRRFAGLLREVLPGQAALEPTHLLSNGRYSVALRSNGAGWSRWGPTGITRQRDDALRDAHGSFFYLRMPQQPQLVSLTQHPAPDARAAYQSVYHADRVCFDATWGELHTHMTAWVSPEDDIEFRTIDVHNLSGHALDLELLSSFEVTLTEHQADEAHPAFTNMFVSAQWQGDQQALLFERTPRLATEGSVHMAHFLTQTDARVTDIRIQTDRQRWLGRNHGAAQPLASLDPAPAAHLQQAQVLVTGLDPVCVLAARFSLEPGAQIQLTFATAASHNRAALGATIDKYRQPNNVGRASLMSATLTGIRLRTLRMSPDNFSAMQTLTTALVLSVTRAQQRARPCADGVQEVCDRRTLWRFGISAERPLVLVSANDLQGLGLLRALAQALSLWSWGGVACDLVIVNAEPASYTMALQREIIALQEHHVRDTQAQGGSGLSGLSGFHVLRANELSADEWSTLKAYARVWLHTDGRPLAHHVQEWLAWHEEDFDVRHEQSTAPLAANPSTLVEASAPKGTFSKDGEEFGFQVSATLCPARPWINVLSNPDFGAQISEGGGGYTWAVNSRLNQITTWSNDPVTDTPSEWFFVQDMGTRKVWGVFPSARGNSNIIYEVIHGQGYTRITHRRGDLEVTASWCVDAKTSVKQITLALVNHGHKTLPLRVIGVAEWIMGANRADRSTVHTGYFTQALGARVLHGLLATQRERSAGFADGSAFLSLALAADEEADWTCDRRELFDARGQLVMPDHFGQSAGGGLDPCAALSARTDLKSGESGQWTFLLGYASSPSQAQQLCAQAAAVPSEQRMAEVRSAWDQLLGATQVKTPDALFDAMVNRWLLYQTVSCRLWAKAGFYQAGGATGFRDQLQDAMALSWAAPHMLRQQIVLCASRQFEAGDVQHWWHAPLGAGVRTHFSDDLLWLPFACIHYLRTTGDSALLDQRVAFIDGPDIAAGAEDAYYTPSISSTDATVYEHAARAIDRSLRVGAHGLPLMGTGDWNDGMNRVGVQGRGESVWLGWFLCQLVTDFAPLAHARNETARAQAWESAQQAWKLSLNGAAWDGQWFKRAFFDDGQALGSSANTEARIDLIAQAWSVLSNATTPDMQRMAMQAADTHLVDTENGLIKLLDPPLHSATPSAGYIQAYPAGVRENGGQYSHAGVWAMMAVAQLANVNVNANASANANANAKDHSSAVRNLRDDAYRYFTYLSPAHRANHPTWGAAYAAEPYVLAGDVYTQPPYVGRAGWSWYTGAAAWMHRGAVESIFGLKLGAHELSFEPCMPSHWSSAELTLVRGARTMRFILINADLRQALSQTLALDAKPLLVGQTLHWSSLPPNSAFVIALQSSP